MGTACVVGAGAISINERNKIATVTVGGKTVTLKEGDWISLDGTTGEVYRGPGRHAGCRPQLAGVLATFMSWADEFRGKFGVRANADIPRDAKVGARHSAPRASACAAPSTCSSPKTASPHMQAMILARDEKNRRKALAKLLPMQRRDFAGLFEAMDGFPVVIRTLDPPLHEFLPKREELMVDIAMLPYADIKKKKEMVATYAATSAPKSRPSRRCCPSCCTRVEELHEFNPMLGLRGCRLGITVSRRSPKCRRAPFSKPPCRWPRRA